jgi:hypothetical protein
MEKFPVLQSSPSTPDALEKVLTLFEAWRRNRKHRSPIPKSLWAAAVEACRSHSVYHVSSVLHLNYNALKARVACSNCRESSSQHSAPEGFVELVASQSPARCTVEIENSTGATMKISFEGDCPQWDPTALASAFLRDGL